MGLLFPQHVWIAESALLLGALLGSNYQEAVVFLAYSAAFLFVLDLLRFEFSTMASAWAFASVYLRPHLGNAISNFLFGIDVL